MKLKLACADFAFPLLSHEHALDLIALLGFRSVDVGLFEGHSHLWPSRAFQDAEQAAKELVKRLRDRGLQASDIYFQPAQDFISLAPNHPDEAVRVKSRGLFENAVEFASACGSSHITALPGVRFDHEPKDACVGRCSEELAWRCERARKAKITFSVLPHVGSIVAVPWEADRLVKNTHGLTLTLDYSQFTREGFPDDTVEPLLRHASHVHARGAKKGHIQSPWKDNVIKFEHILKLMERENYRGSITIAYITSDWEHCNDVDNLSETIRMRDFLLGHGRPARKPLRTAKA
jgi:sugar phosphate isomerase/epimerase